MKRVALMLSALAILFVAANVAEAHGFHHYGHRHYYGRRVPVVVQPRVLMGPRLVVPVPVPPPVIYRPVPRYRYYAPVPRYNFYYRGRGLSFGFGF